MRVAPEPTCYFVSKCPHHSETIAQQMLRMTNFHCFHLREAIKVSEVICLKLSDLLSYIIIG